MSSQKLHIVLIYFFPTLLEIKPGASHMLCVSILGYLNKKLANGMLSKFYQMGLSNQSHLYINTWEMQVHYGSRTVVLNLPNVVTL